ncbi:CBM96 family carbohydrate-binding protein [Desertivirga xinjiangensis]|uniref:CBM96 family carbohydrate-binding protein n=1 Tax=Desertivirga xinjiangensis TaxID=539206 RepID=UPI00210B87FA|nr:DNRLRE domain-containing protein [Pedobacter xinjiangensis]
MNRKLIFNVLILAIFSFGFGCGKLEFLKNEQLEAVDAGSNLKGVTFSEYLALDHSKDLTNLNLYADAIRIAGLSDYLNKPEDYTVLFLTNQAVASMVRSLGYEYLAEVPPVVLKNILSDHIFKGRLRSFDLTLGETRKMETINGSFIYYTRSATSSNEYILTANNSSDLNAPAAVIRSQNLEFKNGIAHVSDQFTFYKLKDAVPDAPSGSVGNQTDIIDVTKDLFIQNGTANRAKNFNNATSIDMKNSNGKDVSVDRMGLFQFPLRTPTFGNKIGLAKINFYVYFTGLASSLNAYAGANTDFDETTVTWQTAPSYDRVSLANVSLNASYVGWISMDVTSQVNQLYGANRTFLNILMNHNNDNFVKIYPREYSAGRYKAYLSLSSPPPTILSFGSVAPLNIDRSLGFAKLTTSELKMTGTADKNISYIVTRVPENGYLVKYGIPLPVNASFSQTDLANGSIKYLFKGTGSTDEIEVEAKDHNGGYYEAPLKITINIQ